MGVGIHIPQKMKSTINERSSMMNQYELIGGVLVATDAGLFHTHAKYGLPVDPKPAFILLSRHYWTIRCIQKVVLGAVGAFAIG